MKTDLRKFRFWYISQMIKKHSSKPSFTRKEANLMYKNIRSVHEDLEAWLDRWRKETDKKLYYNDLFRNNYIITCDPNSYTGYPLTITTAASSNTTITYNSYNTIII